MDEKKFMEIYEIYERIAKLEQTLENGLRDDIRALVEDIRGLREQITKSLVRIERVQTIQNIQWGFIWAVLLAIVAAFLGALR